MARKPLPMIAVVLSLTGATLVAAPSGAAAQVQYPVPTYPQPAVPPNDSSPAPASDGEFAQHLPPGITTPTPQETLDARRVARSLYRGRAPRSLSRLWMQGALDAFVRREDLRGRRLRVARSGRVAPLGLVCLAERCRIVPRLEVRATRSIGRARMVERFSLPARTVRLARGEGAKVSPRLTRRQRAVVRGASRATIRVTLSVDAPGGATYGSLLQRTQTFRIDLR
jgi:hypothetical protein